jgi:hypothetical protein
VKLALAPLLLLGGCALSPGQLDPVKVTATDSCVAVVFLGNPLAGASTATATIPVSALPKLGILAVADVAATLPTNAITFTCTVQP